MADWNWQSLALQGGGAMISATGGWLVGIWRWGRKSAKDEQAVKDDYDGKIRALRDEMRVEAKAADDRNELLVDQFKETLDGLRRQMDQNTLDTEKYFLRKDDFKEFREEYRQNTRRIFEKLDSLPR